ncbi:SGT1 protein-domain-containing protein [Delphinella strobiligena]|nr:SGT1 protein-domain-containing protein [Delphinella strobiligena]
MDGTTQDQDFKWVDEEGFQGFPKRLPEDCVEYSIFIIDQKLKAQEALLKNRLKEIQTAATELSKRLIEDYIWQRDTFNLELVHPHNLSGGEADDKQHEKDKSPHPYFLKGQTNFGDSIADEWLIVYLLRELSKKFPDAYIRVHDTDGEFLLIEAANTLPKWLDPEIAPYRIWINRGQLRIVPMTRDAENGVAGPKTPGLPAEISLKDAIAFIETTPKSLIHSPFIEEEAFHRLNDYPSAIVSSHHHALLSIPRKLAYILHANPSYISPAVEAFYLRDPIALKPLATKDTATLVFPPEDFVDVSVKFNKVGYAQLYSQDFPPPASWTSVIPRIKDSKVAMGMKLTCGFEMLLRDPQNQDKRVVREMKLLLEDLEEGEDELPTNKEIAAWPKVIDDESWLDINFEDFEKELDGKGKPGSAATTENKTSTPSVAEAQRAAKAEGFGDPKTQVNLKNIVSNFERFLNDDNAGPEGAAFSDDDDDDMSSYHSSDTDSEKDEGEDKAASFSEAEFEKAMREMMGMPQTEKESSGLVDEARKLALEMEEEKEMERDEEAEVKEIMRLMEEELKGHGALDLDGGKGKARASAEERQKVKEAVAGRTRADRKGQNSKGKNVGFAPGLSGKGKARAVEVESEDEDEDDAFDSGDEDPLGGMDVDLLKNLLESFKGQAGTAGPASNLMGLMGVKMPRDEGGPDDK